MATELAYIVPLNTIPQTFQINLAGTQYTMTCKFNAEDYDGNGSWVIGFADSITGDEIIDNMPLVTGIDLLNGLEYLGFQGSLIIYTNGDDTAVPTLTNLGIESNLYFLSTVSE